MATRIEDYALIGDCQSVALVANNGSIDWLCLPRFDSLACFAALLGTPDHGRWLIAPAAEVRATRRRYREETLILETDFETDSGLVTLIDFMPPRSAAPDLFRIVECKRGEVPMRCELVIRFDYGSIIPWVQKYPGGIRATAGPDTLYCRSNIPLHGKNMHTQADFVLKAGQRVQFELTWTATHDSEPRRLDPHTALAQTEEWWRQWSSHCTYQGPWRDAVLRSLITLKALTYAPTGGIAAAATASLPERIGGIRNWDYRFCWLRDATFTLDALMATGFTDEARAWRGWLINAAAGTPQDLQIMYGVAGERRLTELELPWLPGYEGSKPVRIGNDAFKQRQLDVYGEVMDAFHLARKSGLEPQHTAWRVQRGLLRFVEQHWGEADSGVWEVRGPRRQFVNSKVMAWVAMDRGIKAVEQFGLEGDADQWRRVRQQIHDDVCRNGFNTRLNSFVQYYGSDHADAALLMLPLVGFLPASDPRVLGTVEYIRKRLLCDGFVERYSGQSDVDGLPPGEGTFLICSFWLADVLAMMGRHNEAQEMFERLLAVRNDLGLLSEEYDPRKKRMLGNFPQAFSHVGIVNTARNLHQAGRSAKNRAG